MPAPRLSVVPRACVACRKRNLSSEMRRRETVAVPIPSGRHARVKDLRPAPRDSREAPSGSRHSERRRRLPTRTQTAPPPRREIPRGRFSEGEAMQEALRRSETRDFAISDGGFPSGARDTRFVLHDTITPRCGPAHGRVATAVRRHEVSARRARPIFRIGRPSGLP